MTKRSWKSSVRRQDQIVRLFTLLEYVASGMPSRSVKEIYEYMAFNFGVCKRTVKRDLSVMSRIGVITSRSDKNGTLGLEGKYACNFSCSLLREIITAAKS